MRTENRQKSVVGRRKLWFKVRQYPWMEHSLGLLGETEEHSKLPFSLQIHRNIFTEGEEPGQERIGSQIVALHNGCLSAASLSESLCTPGGSLISLGEYAFQVD